MTLRRYSRFISSLWESIDAGADGLVRGLYVGVTVSDGLLSLVRVDQ